jgi:hypothetical protein
MTRSTAAMSALTVLFAAACSDSVVAPDSPTRAAPVGSSRALINTFLPGVVVAGGDAGAFTNAINPTEATRLHGAFWDNVSSDDADFATTKLIKCNIGYYVLGTIPATCLETDALSFANRGGFTGGNYWGDNGGIGGGQDGSSFLFSGQYTYDVKLVGTYAGGTSEVGVFTKVGTTYTFHPVPAWGTKTVNNTITFNTNLLPGAEKGANWGFYVKNTSLNATGSCAAQSACSDATGSYTGAPFQQFSLFISSDGKKLEVGLEDNALSPLWAGNDPINNPTNRDSDYQDYILSVTPSVIAIPGGCTLGFWKTHTGLGPQENDWPSPYVPGVTTLGGAGFVGTGNQTTTMLDALSFKGGPSVQDAKNLLMKQAVAALLNAATPGMNYPLSVANVISMVNTALASGDRQTILNLAGVLEADNSLEGPLC